MAETKTFQVIDGPLSVRALPNGTRLSVRLQTGDRITVQADSMTLAGDYVWYQHDKGWSAERKQDGTSVFMRDISDQDANAPRKFKVTDGPLSIRQTPGGTRLSKQLSVGTVIEVVPTSRTEASGYIWWQHTDGWSAERASYGVATYMQEVFDDDNGSTTPIIETPRVTKVTIDRTKYKGKMTLQVSADVKVRGEPSTNPRGLVIRTVTRGTSLLCDMDNITEADGYYWVKHDLGWSAWQSLDGGTVFLAEPGTIPGLVEIGEYGPVVTQLPDYQSLIQRLPVDLNDIQWFQYFGNNMWAYVHGPNYGYDRYSQGLHGGLDLGNSRRAGIPVYAGIEGKFLKADTGRAKNYRIFIEKDDYIFIYQHIINLRSFSAGQAITPDTVVGEIQHSSQNGGWDHLHFEIRYMKQWIINPLVLMPTEMQQQIISNFNPEKANTNYKNTSSLYNFFYKTDTWTQWTTPLDQPCLKLAGPVIGPRAVT